MRILQIVLPDASEYERKSQRVDLAALAGAHDVALTDDPRGVRRGDADVAHVYGRGELPAALFRRFPLPYVASGEIRTSIFPFRKSPEPDYVVSPVEVEGHHLLPEAVEDIYFRRSRLSHEGMPTIGTFSGNRAGVAEMVELTRMRLERFRDDVRWRLFERPPTPDELAPLDAWVDPAAGERDFDGCVAEALAGGVTVVATRTPINVQRLEKGRCGWLVPPRDPNELAHAILNALFKPELSATREAAAQQTISKFHPRQRLRVLSHMYETLHP